MAERDERGEAFVVWLDPQPGRSCAGRVEHVSTARREAFASAEELIAFLTRHRDASRALGRPTRRESPANR